MARKASRENSIFAVTKEDFDSQGYYKGYSIMAGRALLILILHRKRVFDCINKTKKLSEWRKSVDVLKEKYPADYLWLLKKSRAKGRSRNEQSRYISHSASTYLKRLTAKQRGMVLVCTSKQSFTCSSSTVAAYWMEKTLPVHTKFKSQYGKLLAFPSRHSINDRLYRYGSAEYYYHGGFVKITRVKNDKKAGEEA